MLLAAALPQAATRARHSASRCMARSLHAPASPQTIGFKDLDRAVKDALRLLKCDHAPRVAFSMGESGTIGRATFFCFCQSFLLPWALTTQFGTSLLERAHATAALLRLYLQHTGCVAVSVALVAKGERQKDAAAARAPAAVLVVAFGGALSAFSVRDSTATA